MQLFMFGRIVHTLPCIISDINNSIAMDIKTSLASVFQIIIMTRQKIRRNNNMVLMRYVMTFGVYARRDFLERAVVVVIPP